MKRQKREQMQAIQQKREQVADASSPVLTRAADSGSGPRQYCAICREADAWNVCVEFAPNPFKQHICKNCGHQKDSHVAGEFTKGDKPAPQKAKAQATVATSLLTEKRNVTWAGRMMRPKRGLERGENSCSRRRGRRRKETAGYVPAFGVMPILFRRKRKGGESVRGISKKRGRNWSEKREKRRRGRGDSPN